MHHSPSQLHRLYLFGCLFILVLSLAILTTLNHFPATVQAAPKDRNHSSDKRIIESPLDSTQSTIKPIDTAEDVTPPRPHIHTSGAVGQSAVVTRSPRAVAARTETVAVMPQSIDDWSADFYESFEGEASGTIPQGDWSVLDDNTDSLDRVWGIDDSKAYSGTNSVWIAASGADGLDPASNPAPNNLDTWLTIDLIFDLSTVQMADVEFYMFMETEPISDTIFVGASLDDQTYYGEYWSGTSGGWQYYNLDLSEFIGYDEVYISWFYQSDGGNADGKSYAGVWIDEVTVWTYVDNGPAIANDLILNGDFELGDLSNWTVPPPSTAVVELAENPETGEYVAWLGGIDNADEIFYQAIAIPDTTATFASIGFWINQFGEEDQVEGDLFCAGLYGAQGVVIDLDTLLVDLGCLDGIDAPITAFDPEHWWQVDYLLAGDEWEAIRGQTVYLAFEMFTDEELDTTVYIDDVTVELVTGGSPGDRLEPNDFVDEATPAIVTGTLPISYTALSIDPDFDYDLFRVDANAGDTILVNVDAEVNGSPLDAIAYLWDEQETIICENDDDEFTLDPYLTCKVESIGTYYVAITSYDESGDRSNVYSLAIERIPANTEPPANPAPVDDDPPQPTPPANTWTAMIFMDGDTNLCGVYPGLVNRVEQELGAKIGPDGFLKVLVLLDRIPTFCPGEGKATRYFVQPDGQYTDGVNRWDMGEINMGDPETLQNFIEWGMRNYPADKYYLAIDDHGAGVTGIAWDDTNRDSTNKKDRLTNAELYSVLKTVTQNGERTIDILAYEACLMGMFENTYDVRHFVDHLFFFPTVSYTNAASYPSYLNDPGFTNTTGGRAFGEIMFDVYRTNVTRDAYAMTLVSTAQITDVHVALNNWADALSGLVATEREKITLARSQAQKIDSNSDKQLTDRDQYIDLWDLADKIAAQGLAVTESNVLKAAIETAVLKNTNRSIGNLNYDNVHGLSIFWPQTASSWYRPYVDGRIYTSTRDGTWDEFLATYFGQRNGGRSGMQTDPGPTDREAASTGNTVYLPLVNK